MTAHGRSYVFVFVDDCPWVIEGVPWYETQAEADAFVDGFHYYAGEDSTAKLWPFSSDDMAKTMRDVDAKALMVDVLAGVEAMGLVTP